MARSSTAVAGRWMAYAPSPRSRASERAGMAKAASARTTTACPPGLGPLNDREEGLLSPVSPVNVAWPERGGQAVAVLVEDEERMLAGGRFSPMTNR